MGLAELDAVVVSVRKGHDEREVLAQVAGDEEVLPDELPGALADLADAMRVSESR